MRVLGHHVAAPALMFAILDGCLFLAALYAVGFAGTPRGSYVLSATHLHFYQAALMACAFVAVSAAIGLYNRDALLEFRVFVKRFLLSAQFVFLPSVLILGIAKAIAGAEFGWYLGILSVDIGVFFFVLFVIRVFILWIADFSFLKRRILVIGGTPEAQAVVDFIARDASSHLRCVGHLKTPMLVANNTIAHGNLALRIQEDATTVPLLQTAKTLGSEEIVVAAADRRGLPMWQMLECKLSGIQVSDYMTFWERETGRIDLQNVTPGWLAMADGFRRNWVRGMIKRSIDVAVSVVFLVAIALPVGALVALLIRLEGKGPLFYKQERVGQNGRVFWIWKFRSMRVDAEKDGVPRWASTKDDRVTRVGKIIRKLRIDEFPQVLNVLTGEMSFIGPRPERPFFVEQLSKEIPLYDLRHTVQPGVTGWAQVNAPYGASLEDARKKLAYDLYYVKNQSPALDIMILLQTVRVLLFSEGGR